MPASDSAEAGLPLKNRVNFWSAFRERLKVLTPLRWIFLVLGVASISYGQYLIEQRYTQGEPFPRAQLWNDIYKLQIVNFDNALHALPYLIGGAFLCGFVALPAAWKTSFSMRRFDILLREQIQWKKQLPYILSGGFLFVFLIVQLARHTYHSLYLLLWITSIIAFTYVTWRWDRNANKDLSPGITLLDVFWIASLLILGFIINTYALNDIPTILIPDEGKFWEIARAIAIKDLQPPFFGSGVYTFPIASSIYQGWILRLCGLNLWSWRFSSVFAGVITVIPLYLLGREWFDRRVAIAAAVLMVANPYFISFTRLGYNNSQSLFPVTLSIYFFALAARKGSVFYFWLAGVLTGIGFYTYSAAWLGPMTLCLGMLYLLALKQLNLKQMLVTLTVILLAWGVLFVPRVAYTASGEDSQGLVYKIFETSFVNTFYAKAFYGEADLLQTSPFVKFSENDTIFYEPVIYRELLFRGAVRTLLALFDPYIVREHFLVMGFTGGISAIFFLIGIALTFRLWKQMRFGIPLIWLTAGLIFLSTIAAFPPRHTHLVSIIPVLALISGIGLVATLERLMELMLSRRALVQTIVHRSLLALISAAIIYSGFHTYFVTMPVIYPPSFEDIASWVAWKTNTYVNLIYLSREDKPHRVQYLVDTKLALHNYESSTFDKFISQNLPTKNIPAILFVEENSEVLESKLRDLPGFSVPIPYSYTDGSILGYVVTNTIIDINPDVDREEGIRSLIATPVIWIFIPLVFIVVVSGWIALAENQTMLKHQAHLQGVQ
jgi:4-amino-4-deoxy-L-arabinose transferase-like glycosyltransferase